MGLVLLQPLLQVEVVELLAPQHAGQRLPVHAALILVERRRRDPLVEFVRLAQPLFEDRIEIAEGIARQSRSEAQAYRPAPPGGNVQPVMRRRLRPHAGGIHRTRVSRDDTGVKRVLDVGRCIGLAPKTLHVGLVFREQQLGAAVARQPLVAQFPVRGVNDARRRLAQSGLRIVHAPRPGIPEPQRRQQPQPRSLRAAVMHGDLDEHVLRTLLGVLHEYIKIPVVVEDPGIQQFVLHLLTRPPAVGVHQVAIGELPLRILVQVLHVGVRGSAVHVEVVLLHILAVVALAVGEPEQALFQDGIALVPQRHGKTKALLVVGDPSDSVFSPPVRPGAGVVMGEIVPGVSVLAVIFADRAPLPFAEVGSPLLPRDAGLTGFVQPLLLGNVDDCLGHGCPPSAAQALMSPGTGTTEIILDSRWGKSLACEGPSCGVSGPQTGHRGTPIRTHSPEKLNHCGLPRISLHESWRMSRSMTGGHGSGGTIRIAELGRANHLQAWRFSVRQIRPKTREAL